jgi:DNA-binding NtrC family response regulator
MLIADPDPGVCQLCAAIGQGMGLVCWQAGSAGEALERLECESPDLMLTDLVLGEGSGLELLAEVKKRSPFTEVALMSSYGTIESAVQGVRLGAYDFIVKPLQAEELKLLLERMVEKVRLVRENEALRRHLHERAPTAPVHSTDLEELERFTVQRVFEQVDGDKELAQKLLGISRATLYRKLKRYGIGTRSKRQEETEQGSRVEGERLMLLSQS